MHGVLVLLALTSLRAGAAKVEITPDLSRFKTLYLAGFGWGRKATGVSDPLFARALVLDDGNVRIGLVSCDLIGLLYEPDVLSIRRMAKDLGLNYLLIACTHTHQSPDTIGLWGKSPFHRGVNEGYVRWLRKRIVEAVREAARRLEPARAFYARFDHPYLRLAIADTRPPLVYDHRLYVLKFARLDGSPLATIVNWANHPEAMGSKNTLISADYPAALYEQLDRKEGVTLFFVGAIGGLMTPLGEIKVEGAKPPPEGAERARAIGEMLVRMVRKALAKATQIVNPFLRYFYRQLFVPVQNERFLSALRAGVLRRPVYLHGGRLLRLPPHGSVEVRTEVAALSIGEVIIACIPGEIYPELVYGGIERLKGADFPDAPFEPLIMERARRRPLVVIGLANDELGYIIPKAEWDAVPPWLCGSEEETYGEVNSCGPETARLICEALSELVGALAR